MIFDWDDIKSKKLIKDRNISFEEIVLLIEQDGLLDTVDNPSAKYGNQQMFIVDVKGYVYLVPFVKHNDVYFLKTIFPSRKATKQYLTQEDDDET